ncbi:MAG: F0F1 ATP synthase subunit delta [Candidatus Omnitrophica bacterium]|nr:F0F1 ATP synthase subunit delta [Candidatus Omnitrophota bacterium]
MLVNLLIIQTITFIGIFFLLRFLFSRHLNAALARLNTLHEENLIKEQQLTDELKRAKEEGDAEIKRAKDEAGLIIEEAGNEGVRLRANMEEQAKIQVTKIIADGNNEAERFKEKCMKETDAHSLDLAMKLVEQLLSEKDKESLQQEFISEIISEIAKLSKDQFSIASDRVKVNSSHPLRKDQRENLQRVLKEKTGTEMIFEEVLSKDLIGGLIVEIGGLIIDGTLKNKLQRILPYFRKK